METRERKSRWGLTVILISLVGYFGGRGVTGDFGLMAWAAIRADHTATIAHRDALRTHEARLADAAVRLRDASLDLDYLDERARAVVGLARPGERIVPAQSLPASLALEPALGAVGDRGAFTAVDLTATGG